MGNILLVSRGDTFHERVTYAGTKKILKYFHSQEAFHAPWNDIFIAVQTIPFDRSDRFDFLRILFPFVAGPESLEPDFVGAPYEFWVGANVPVGTSVGQIRLNDAVKTNDLIYDLLHSYEEGGT